MSHATTMLAAIEATLETLATKGVASMTINGRTIEYKSSKELLELRSKYLREVKDEQDLGKRREQDRPGPDRERLVGIVRQLLRDFGYIHRSDIPQGA